ncbi:MAG: amino acid-binding protein [Bacillota bacterium]
MTVQQISVFIENRRGRLLAVTRCMGDNNINIRALSLADTSDFGIVRMIVDQPEAAYNALKEGQFTVHYTNVIALGVDDEPGGLSKALTVLDDNDINIEYVYAFYAPLSGRAINVLRTSQMDKAIKLLEEKGFTVLQEAEVYGIQSS